MNVDGTPFRVEEVGNEIPPSIFKVSGKSVRAEIIREISRAPLTLLVRSDKRVLNITVRSKGDGQFHVLLNGRPFDASLETVGTSARTGRTVSTEVGPVVVSSPMAGRIISLKASVGSVTEEGQAIVVLEAMKMENEIASPKKGVVREVYVRPGSLVKAGDKLALVV